MPNHASDGSDTTCDVSGLAAELNEDQQEVSRILGRLRQDPSLLGCISLGRDGIMRSLTADRDVIDAAPFSPKNIKSFLDRMPYDSKAEEEYRGVDGTQVPQQKWFHPDKSMLPPPLTQEQKESTMKLMEEHKELFQVRKEKIAKGENYSTCPVVVRSNHDLSVKPVEKDKNSEDSPSH